jgi:hypothetical protein
VLAAFVATDNASSSKSTSASYFCSSPSMESTVVLRRILKAAVTIEDFGSAWAGATKLADRRTTNQAINVFLLSKEDRVRLTGHTFAHDLEQIACIWNDLSRCKLV